ncbi:Copper amine oxidase N-terminal domain-containing protein [Paenibacillus sp. OV219]|nr:Copper amine oxidase N-terminal domain-containing protein [Paenibacillus sp. OV219]
MKPAFHAIKVREYALLLSAALLLSSLLIGFVLPRPAEGATQTATQTVTQTASPTITPTVTPTTQVKRFHLYATDGEVKLADGKRLYIWGYSLKNEPGTAILPSPTLTVNEGDKVEVTLTNIGPLGSHIKKLAHTIHFHGLDTDQANDGVPHTSQAILPGESFTYRFTATHAGTYFYHCHVDTIEHLQMGMHGAFIVRAKGGAPEDWTGGPRYDKDYVFLLNEIDPIWHEAVEKGETYDRTDYHPRYWTINGKSYPDTESDPATMVEGRVGDSILIRLINSGYDTHSIHMHGEHFQVIASDGRPLPAPLTKDTIEIAPGERYDILVKLTQSGHFPIHSHNIKDNTNDGLYPGGMHTMMMVSPALSDRVVNLTNGKKTAIIDGKSKPIAAAPFLQGKELYVPIRLLQEEVRFGMRQGAKAGEVVLTLKANELKLTAGSKNAVYNGKKAALTSPVQLLRGTTFVPLSVAVKYMGVKLVSSSAAEWRLKLPQLPPSPSTFPVKAPTTAEVGPADTTQAEPTTSGTDHTMHDEHGTKVTISATGFSVKELHVKAGTTVTWVNGDKQGHTVTDLDGRFNSKTIPATRSWSYTFKDVGTYTYYCSVHPTMQAIVIVDPA